jgi:ComF family protein
MTRLKKFFFYILYSLSDFLFPPSCMICENYLSDDLFVCPDCLKSLKTHKNESKDSISVFKYGTELKMLVHELKYNDRPEIGVILGREMGKRLKDFIEPDNTVFLPVPLHKKRLRKRGYNQSEMICRGLCGIINIPVEKDMLSRKVNNDSQTGFNATGRAENVKGIFIYNGGGPDRNSMILLVDDLITTGATTKEAVSELKRNGFNNFFSISAATSSR